MKKRNENNSYLFIKLFRFLSSKTWLVLGLLLSLIIMGYVNTYPIKLTKSFIDTLTDKDTYTLTRVLSLIMIYFAVRLAYVILDMANRYLIAYLGNSITAELRQRLFDHTLDLSFSFHDNRNTSDLIARSTSDVNTISGGLIGPINWLGNRLIMFIWYVIFLGSMDWQLTLIYIAAGIVIYLISQKVSQASVAVRSQVLQKQASMWNVFYEALSGVREIQAFMTKGLESSKFKEENQQVKGLTLKEVTLTNIINGSSNMLFYIAVGFTWLLGGLKLYEGSLQIGELVAFISYGSGLLGPLIDGSLQYEQVRKMLVSAKRVFDILDTESQVFEKESPVNPASIEGHIKIEKLTFGYDNGPLVLDNISLDIKPGEKIAIIGHTGSAKTTLIKLLCRFYDPISGAIYIDNHNLKDLPLASIRDNMGIMFQDYFLFNGSIYDNIAMGKNNPTEDDVINAAKLAQAHEFIVNLPGGYQTIVGERGTKLSGGQKQRIGLARAIIRNPKILILDEATSSVDSITESSIIDSLEQFSKGRTCIIITHNVPSIKSKVDRIILLEKGRIIESGTHKELMKNSEVYKKLYDSGINEAVG